MGSGTVPRPGVTVGVVDVTDIVDYWRNRALNAQDAGRPLRVTPWEEAEIARMSGPSGVPIYELRPDGTRTAFGIPVAPRLTG
jgi:hypothetical protein